jgi:hypothetical protein
MMRRGGDAMTEPREPERRRRADEGQASLWADGRIRRLILFLGDMPPAVR